MQLLSEEEMLLCKTREPTISFPVVAAWGRDFYAVALIQPCFRLHCPLTTEILISVLIKRISLQPVLPSDTGWEMVSSGMKLSGLQTDLRSSHLGTLLANSVSRSLSFCVTVSCRESLSGGFRLSQCFSPDPLCQRRSSRHSWGLHSCNSSHWQGGERKKTSSGWLVAELTTMTLKLLAFKVH